MEILMGRKYTKKKRFLFFFLLVFLFFFPNTVTAYVKSYTLYCIYAILTPA